MPDNGRPRVLVVDDDEDFRLVLESMLAKKYDVSCLESGDGLMDELTTSRPDVLILDVMMPGKGGFELCREVRSKPALANLPILFLTSSHTDADFVRNVDAGGSGYLTKPVTQKALLAKVGELII
jgi:DNA-binding response OmpR family regulator